MKFKTVVIFGVFDRIHQGHLQFIKQAKKQGGKLVVIVARNDMVKKLKGKIPLDDEFKRLDIISKIDGIDLAFLGDKKQGIYDVLKKIKPDIIFLGYDQKDLFDDISKKIKTGYLNKVELVIGKSYKPKLFHSSILNKKIA